MAVATVDGAAAMQATVRHGFQIEIHLIELEVVGVERGGVGVVFVLSSLLVVMVVMLAVAAVRRCRYRRVRRGFLLRPFCNREVGAVGEWGDEG